jgi:glyoxylase-like metal-dependent hydrolase (beta-lactamase superfamily II)
MAGIATAALPPAGKDQVYLKVSALEGGQLTLPEALFVTDPVPDLRVTVPSLCFFIRHPTATLLFDLGLRRDLSGYPQAQHAHISQRQPIILLPDVAEHLRSAKLDPTKDIDYVMLSHVHWDHVGTPTDFPNAKFVVGSGTLHLLEHGAPNYPADTFDTDLLPRDRTYELPPTADTAVGTAATQQLGHFKWEPFAGVFPNAIDFFKDGSMYVVDSPGHLYGHVNLLVRVSASRWLYLGGDCCHDVRILKGTKQTAMYDDGRGGKRSVHANTPSAKETIARIQNLLSEDGKGNVTIEPILAHDKGWRENNPHKFLPGLI